MRKAFLTLAISASLVAFSAPVKAETDANAVVRKYAVIVHKNYQESYEDALELQRAVNALLENPGEKTLKAAKNAWLDSRESYGQTEAYRFYEGPIDFADKNGNEGPEARLNSWPLDEAYIDYVQGNPEAGIVNNPGVEITKASLTNKNQADDEAEVATGYHAIEFLLWGQDLSLETAGQRPASDYAKTPENERRRTYLRVVTDLLVDDLKFLVDAWKPGEDNYAQSFVHDENALAKIMTALATLSGFELAAERMATALDSGDQEDEHSCFSDNTHNDFIYNAKGVSNVFFYTGLYSYLKEQNPELAEELEEQILKTRKLLAALPHPIDREILSTPEGSEARGKMEAAVASLQKQADLFKEAGQSLNLDVQILN